jgi:hypothetical protein
LRRERYSYLPSTVSKEKDYDTVHQGSFGDVVDIPSTMDLGKFVPISADEEVSVPQPPREEAKSCYAE